MSDVISPVPTPRGWYADPEDPTKDRWWDGTSWTSYRHRSATLRRSMFGPGYARMWWPGPNRAAGLSLLLARISIGGLLLALIVALIADAAGHGHLAFGPALTVLSVVFVATVVSITGIVFGAIGVARSEQPGARLVAIWGLCASIVGTLISAPIAVVLIYGAINS